MHVILDRSLKSFLHSDQLKAKVENIGLTLVNVSQVTGAPLERCLSMARNIQNEFIDQKTSKKSQGKIYQIYLIL